MDMNLESIEGNLLCDRNRFQKGQMILYEGKEAEVISVSPMLIIKAGDRVICGALHNRIEFIEEQNTHIKTNNNYIISWVKKLCN
ncbi:MAG: hypothetical protein JRJ00_02090 [Deltaproteobacteria bacterium]|nr:hypothetical protein [Deltaproteobacteria bacterium]